MPVFRTITPQPKDPVARLADWIELEAIRSENGVGSLRELAQAISLAGTKDDPNANEVDSRVSVDDLAHVAAEVERRAAAAGPGVYPFSIDGAGSSAVLTKNWEKSIYCWLLLLSYVDARSSFTVARRKYFHARLFEALATVAAHNFLGGNANQAEVFRFGWPRPNRTNFRQALDSLAAATGGRVLDYSIPKWEKDERLDVFAWRRFPDGRCNRLALFGQCAGGDDWDVKGPVPQRFLGMWLKLHAPSPWPVLFVPRLLDDHERMKEEQVTLVFDRCRIASLVPLLTEPQLVDEGFSAWMGHALHVLGARAPRN